MVPLLDRLAVEVRGEVRQRLGVVVDRDRDVLLRGGELVADLLVDGVVETAHGATLSARRIRFRREEASAPRSFAAARRGRHARGARRGLRARRRVAAAGPRLPRASRRSSSPSASPSSWRRLALRVGGRLQGRPSPWIVRRAPAARVRAQELIERLVAGLPAHAVFEPAVYAGLAAQAPVALLAYLAARALLRVADESAEALASADLTRGAPRRPAVPAPLPALRVASSPTAGSGARLLAEPARSQSRHPIRRRFPMRIATRASCSSHPLSPSPDAAAARARRPRRRADDDRDDGHHDRHDRPPRSPTTIAIGSRAASPSAGSRAPT